MIAMELKPFKRSTLMSLPVAFISTISKDGIRNIAPYGCVMPVLRPLDLVCVASAKRRDTMDNIRETGEFVVNLPGVGLADKVMPTARYLPPEADEFEYADLEEKPSKTIKAPGIKGCYAWMECTVDKLFEEPQYILIMGKILRLEVDDGVCSDGNWDVKKARPLMMTSSKKGMSYCTVEELGIYESPGAMFPDGKDPMAKMYE
jgi:flavin reductase (DIM6/NTAB) family NADH-FMN oxidoreductase RutF